jgi:hypothetical protein
MRGASSRGFRLGLRYELNPDNAKPKTTFHRRDAETDQEKLNFDSRRAGISTGQEVRNCC